MIHERKTLVQRPHCRISRCSCGVYHLSTGAVTLRMHQGQLEDLFKALGEVLTSEEEPAEEGTAIH